MKKKTLRAIMFVLAGGAIFAQTASIMSHNLVCAHAESEVIASHFKTLKMTQSDGNNSIPIRFELGIDSVGNASGFTNTPDQTYSGIKFYDVTAGQYITPSYGFGASSSTSFIMSLKTITDFECNHIYNMEIKEGTVLQDAVVMDQTQYIQFKIYVNDAKTGFCFSSMFTPLVLDNPKWAYKDSKVYGMLVTQDSYQGISISNLAINDTTAGDGEGYMHLSSSDVSYDGVLSGYCKALDQVRCNTWDLNYWDKIKFSADGKNWISAINIFGYLKDGDGRLYFNESSTWRIHYAKVNNSRKPNVDNFNYVKFEEGTQLPYYQYIAGTDTENKCYILSKEYTFYKVQNWEYKELDSEVNNAPSFLDYPLDGSHPLSNDWTTGNESGKSFFDINSLPNKTIDFTFDWKCGDGQTYFTLTYQNCYQDVALWNNGGNLYYCEMKLDGFGGGNNCNVAVTKGDVVRVHYTRVYDDDYLGYTSYMTCNGLPAKNSGTHYNVKSGYIDATGKGVIWFKTLNDCAVKAARDDDYSSKTYNVKVQYNGVYKKTVKVTGGTKYSDLTSQLASENKEFETEKVKNELGFVINGEHTVYRNAVVNLTGKVLEKANFTKVNDYNNNKINENETDHTRTYLEFDKKPVNKTSHDNLACEKITFSGVNSSTIEGFKVFCGDIGGNFVIVDIPVTAYNQNASYPYDVLKIEEGVIAYDVILGDVNLYLDPETNKFVPFETLHTVTINGEVKYIPDGLVIPMTGLSEYCSATFKDDKNNTFDITTPITKDMTLTASFIEHDYVKHDAHDATCQAEGNIEYYTCGNNGCEQIFIKDNNGNYVGTTLASVTTPKKDHEIKSGSLQFHWEEDGSACEVTFECSMCHETITKDAIVTSKVTKNASCTEAGETTYTATYETYTDNKVIANIPSTGHKEESISLVNGREATCTSEGYADAYFCTDCELYYSDESCADEYLIGDEDAYEAWKLGAGKVVKNHTCSIHHVGVESTCSTKGYKDYYECSECHQYFEDEAGTKLIGDAVALATWKGNGGQLELNPDKHTYIYVGEVAATEDSSGVKEHYVCSECGKLFILEGETFVEVSLEDLVIPQIKKGCGGSIIATSALISSLALAAIPLLLKKRKEN